MATPTKTTYTNAELNALVAEFSAEFDALVKAEVAKGAQALNKAEMEKSGDSESNGTGAARDPLVKEESKKDAPEGSSGGSESSAGGPPAAESASSPAAAGAPDASMSAPAGAPDPAASAGAPADPAAQAAGADPVAALQQAYAQLTPQELQQHIQALQAVMAAQAPAAAPADPAMAGGMGGMPPQGAGAAPAGMPPAAPPAGPAPAGPDAVAPLAGEGSKPVDPAATMALKSEVEKELSLVKSERDSATKKIEELEKSVAQLTEAMTKVFAQPIRKSISGRDIEGLLGAEKPAPAFESMSKSDITKKLLVVAKDSQLKKADRELINSYYRGAVKVDALAHLLG